MPSRIVKGQVSASLATGSSAVPPRLDCQPTMLEMSVPSCSSPSEEATASIILTSGGISSVRAHASSSSSRDCSAASRRARVVNPMQTLSSRTTGKWDASVCPSTCRTFCSEASGGRIACSYCESPRSEAILRSICRGGSGGRNGMFFLNICSSSKPRSFISWLRSSETVMLIISGGMRLRSLAHPVMNTTTATAICLKPHSMAALPTMA
mmetsp:Transcript_10079/g.28380  ORF Transcript_10079/g.28380 Transcript_10079/m.28380 type:complete len:210 (-) Transcript_10079:1699-2328(-)